MGDLIMVAILFAFFALAWLLVRVCDTIIGPVELPGVEGGVGEEDETDAVAA